MAERWQAAEARSAAVFFRDANGAPVTGLTPTVTVLHKDGSGSAPTGSVTGVGSGFYRVSFSAAPSKDLLVLVDGGGSLTSTRYVALEVPVGGYVNLVDVATSTRATPADVNAGSSSTVTALAAQLTALSAQVGTPAQAAALLTARDLILAQVATRATPADVNVTVTPPIDATVEVS